MQPQEGGLHTEGCSDGYHGVSHVEDTAQDQHLADVHIHR